MHKREMVRVFVQGSFDLFNWGHLKTLERAKGGGDYLIVGVNSDKLYGKYKHNKPVLPYWQRKQIVRSIKYVDKVILCNQLDCMGELKKYNIDVLVIGKEWKEFAEKEIKYAIENGIKIIYTPRYKGNISSSTIKKKICLN